MSDTIEKAKIAKLLLFAEKGMADSFQGKKFDENDSESLPLCDSDDKQEETLALVVSRRERSGNFTTQMRISSPLKHQHLQNMDA